MTHLIKLNHTIPSKSPLNTKVIAPVLASAVTLKWNQPRLIMQPLAAFLKGRSKVAKSKMANHASEGHQNTEAVQKEHSRIHRLLDTDELA